MRWRLGRPITQRPPYHDVHGSLLLHRDLHGRLLKGYSQAGEFGKAVGVVQRMQRTLGRSSPNEVTYNTLVQERGATEPKD